MKFPFVNLDVGYKDWASRQLEGTEKPDITWVRPIINDVVDSLLRANIVWHRIALIEIKDRQGSLPTGFKQVIQAGYNLQFKPQYIAAMTKQIKHFAEGKCKFVVSLECEKCFKTECTCDSNVFTLTVDDWDYPELLYRDNPQLAYSYIQDPWHPLNNRGVCDYDPTFKLLSLAQGSFNNISFHIPNCKNMSVDIEYNYEIEPPVLRTNFNTGWVMLAYLSKPTQGGFLMIPETPKVFEAIRYAIDYEWDYVRSRRQFNNETMGRLQLTKQLKEESWQKAYGELSKITPDELRQMTTVFNKMYPEDDFNNMYRGYDDQYNRIYNL